MHKKGGGVGILVKKNLKCRLNNIDVSTATLEFICMTIQLDFLPSFNILCMYRPPVYSKHTIDNDLENINDILLLLPHDRHNILTGDFNLRTDKTIKKLNEILSKCNYEQLVQTPTRGSSLLDLIITNFPNSLNNVQTYETNITDHLMVITQMTIAKVKKHSTYKLLRNYKLIDYYRFGTEVLQVEEVKMNTCVQQLEYINNNLLQIFNKYAPKES